MATLVDVLRVLGSPQGLAAEKRFVVEPRLNRSLVREYKFSLQRLLELLVQDLTFNEIGAALEIPPAVVGYHYERSCRALTLFENESSRERQARIYKLKRAKKIGELQELPIEVPLLQEIARTAIEQGCAVCSYVSEGVCTSKLRVSPDALIIDGRSCYVHVISNSYQPAKDGSAPAVLSKLHLRSSSLLDFDVRIICVRVPGFGKRTYVVPSIEIDRTLFGADRVRERSLYITLRDRHKGSRTFDVRGFRDKFKTIKNIPRPLSTPGTT